MTRRRAFRRNEAQAPEGPSRQPSFPQNRLAIEARYDDGIGSRCIKWYTRDSQEWLQHSSILVDGFGRVRDNLFALLAGIFASIMALAKGERLRAFEKRVPCLAGSYGNCFRPAGHISVVQVWSDMDRANVAVNREASAIRMVALLAPSFPGEPKIPTVDLIHRRHLTKPFSPVGRYG